MYSSLLDSISLYSQTPTGITPPTLTVIASSSRTLNLNSRVIEPLGIKTHLLVRIFFWLGITKYSKPSITFNSDILCQYGKWPYMTAFFFIFSNLSQKLGCLRGPFWRPYTISVPFLKNVEFIINSSSFLKCSVPFVKDSVPFVKNLVPFIKDSVHIIWLNQDLAVNISQYHMARMTCCHIIEIYPKWHNWCQINVYHILI